MLLTFPMWAILCSKQMISVECWRIRPAFRPFRLSVESMRMVCRCFAFYVILQMGPKTHWSPMRMFCGESKKKKNNRNFLVKFSFAMHRAVEQIFYLLNAVVSLIFLRCPLIAAFGVFNKFCTLGGDCGEFRSSLAPGLVIFDAGGGNVSGNLASKSTSLVVDLVGVVASTWLVELATVAAAN